MPSIEITEFGSCTNGGAVAPDINVQLPSTYDINQRSKSLDDQKRMFTNNLKMLDALLLRKVSYIDATVIKIDPHLIRSIT